VLFLAGARARSLRCCRWICRHGVPRSYVDSGCWSRRAIAEARRYAEVSIAARALAAIPDAAEWQVDPGAAYCHVTSNETAEASVSRFSRAAGAARRRHDVGPADATARLHALSLVYAGTQKTVGTPGLTLVIVDELSSAGHAPKRRA